MKRSTFAILIAAFSLSLTGSGQQPIQGEENKLPLLTVVGRGEASGRPDMAVVRLAVEARANDAAAAQSTVNETMQRVIEQVRKLDIPQRAIRTAGINLMPVYSQRPPGQERKAPEIVGYRAFNTIQVEVSNLDNVGKVIDAGIGAGANRVESVSFELRDDLPQRSDALRLAVQEARAKAETLAEALGVHLGAVHEVNEGGVHVFRPPMAMRGMDMEMAGMSAPTPVEPGELRVEASVTVRYRIESRPADRNRPSAR